MDKRFHIFNESWHCCITLHNMRYLKHKASGAVINSQHVTLLSVVWLESSNNNSALIPLLNKAANIVW